MKTAKFNFNTTAILLTLGLLLMQTAIQAAEVNELNRIVAVVDNEVITAQELEQKVETIRAQLARNNTTAPPEDILRRQVLERLIVQTIQLRMARQMGVRVDDDTVNMVLENIARENGITLSQLPASLSSQGLDYNEFRNGVREELILQRLRGGQVDSRVMVTEQEIDAELQAQSRKQIGNTEYHLRHIMIAVPATATPDDIDAAHSEAGEVLQRLQGGEDFSQLAVAHSDGQLALEGGDLGWRSGGRLPSVFTDAIVGMKEGQLSEVIRSPGGFHILKLLGVRGEEQHVVRQNRTRHILIRTSELVTDNDARMRLERLRQRILNGDDFAELALTNSEDPGSAAQGGDLGWATSERYVPDFRDAIDNTPVGTVSEPFKSDYGWHILEVLEWRDYDDTEEYMRNRIHQMLRQRKIEEETENWLRRLRDEAYVEYRLDS